MLPQTILRKIIVLLLLFFWDRVSYIPDLIWLCLRKDDLELLIFLSPPTEYWDYRWVSRHTWFMGCWGSFRLGKQEYFTNRATSLASGRNISNYIPPAKLNSIANYILLFVSVMCMLLCVCAGARGQPPCCSSGAIHFFILRRALTGLEPAE